MRFVPSRRSLTRPASRSTRRCWEIAGRVTSKLRAISPAVRSFDQMSRRISRRRGSAIARSCASTRTYVSRDLRKCQLTSGHRIFGCNVFTQADAYDRFMGRYSTLLTAQMADLANVGAGQRVLDVGCGPGALTAELVARVGASRVSAVDPSEPFVLAARTRSPGVDVRVGSAEALPFADGSFDAALAQLVVHFMRDPVAGLREMARVTRRGGVVVACVWDTASQSPTTAFWRAAREIDPSVDDESRR